MTFEPRTLLSIRNWPGNCRRRPSRSIFGSFADTDGSYPQHYPTNIHFKKTIIWCFTSDLAAARIPPAFCHPSKVGRGISTAPLVPVTKKLELNNKSHFFRGTADSSAINRCRAISPRKAQRKKKKKYSSSNDFTRQNLSRLKPVKPVCWSRPTLLSAKG